MKTAAAFLLAVLGDNNSPSAEDIKKIFASVGAEADDDRIELLFSGEFVVGLRSSRPEINEKTINNPNNSIIKTSRGENKSPHLLCSEQQMKEKHRGSLQITGGSGTSP
ncbi:hypothetical protein OIU77_013206 [Salix suchowensis]|uniref:60S acidic ribosomal protein P2 n=1 Tax=Salix suchowensis TaxID=1278906 RepID=A0ABQ8ZTP4_9ROSI|nr:hypothetical protein OIU77_013206 [Salix suchowensis]